MHTRHHRAIRVTFAVLAATALAFIAACEPAARASLAHPTRLTIAGRQWFSSGANLPYVHEGRDFGGGTVDGVRSEGAHLSSAFQSLDRDEVRTVRWYVFPGDAWQIERAADGTPTKLNPAVYADFDAALALARQYDLHYDFVLFQGSSMPASWATNPTQRAALVKALAPLFDRYEYDSHVLSWETVDEPERAVDTGSIDLASMQALVRALAKDIHAHSPALATIGPETVDRTALWSGLGLDFYAPHWFGTANPSGPGCALCTTAGAVQQAGVDGPIVIGETDTTTATATERYHDAYGHGYAGLWAWSVFPTVLPQYTTQSGVVLAAAQRLAYQHLDVGPRLRPLNPCTGPKAHLYRCPNLRMSPPSNLQLVHSDKRSILESTSSLNNVGVGPAEIDATRTGHFTMAGGQRLYTWAGGSVHIATSIELFFKAIPHQYRYWKWVNAARFELWKLSPQGVPTKLVRVGPKQIYCLRDLTRTRPGLRYSPAHRIYPGCNQTLSLKRDRLGLDPGWSDIYPSHYFENWIDVTGLRGCYAYIHVADPENHIMESNEFDNRAVTVVKLPYTGSAKGCPGAKKATLIADPSVAY